jgi:uncharacterized ferredoxin-like protein
MTEQKDTKSKEGRDDIDGVNKKGEDSEKECVRFCVDSEEVLDDKEREHLKRDAKKFEPIVDRLFDGNQSQNSMGK